MIDSKQRDRRWFAAELRSAAPIRVHAGEAGVLYDEIGRIVLGHASLHGVEWGLWERLRLAVDQLRLVIDLRVDDPTYGRAVRVVKVGSEAGVWRPATLENANAIRLTEYLRVHGFRAAEAGPEPTVAFGPPHSALNPTAHDRSGHLYVSLPRRRAAESHGHPAPAGDQVMEVERAPPLALTATASS